ncbi:MAG: 50S ribosomal protein L13 [Patescibacteria group bacterium]|nr:50S ribosomal protein L13 [Patescibacteria group bacterium]
MSSIKRKKVELNAAGQSVGRLSSKIATILIGKDRPDFEPHIDKGGKVTVLNAKEAVFTGKKIEKKLYRRHSMYPGGLKETPAKKVKKEDPNEVIRHAVSRMLPKNKMRTARLLRLSFK